MITILIIGFLIAWIVKIILIRFLKAIQFDKVSEQWGLTRILSRGEITYSPTHLLGRFFYWVIVLITLILGINALEVAATQSLITQFFNFLPHLFTALGILVIGYLIGVFLGQATLIAAVNAQMESAKILSRAVRWFIIFLNDGALSFRHCRESDCRCLLDYLWRYCTGFGHCLRLGRKGVDEGLFGEALPKKREEKDKVKKDQISHL